MTGLDKLRLARARELGAQGLAELRAGNLALAGACLGEAASCAPDEPSYHSSLGEVLRLLGEPARGAASCRYALRLDPGHAPAHRCLGLCLVECGDLAAAQRAFQAAWHYESARGAQNCSRPTTPA
jgi:Flp pilus assembly protein TadD